MDRRKFLKLAGAGLALPASTRLLAACGSDAATTTTTGKAGGATTATPAPAASNKPVRKVKLGFIALTDCASIVLAKELGYFAARNLDVTLEKQASWPALRYALVNGQIDGAHCLYSMPAALATLGNQPDHPLRIAMMLNRNGQAITLNAKDFDGVGYADLAGFRSKLEAKPDKLAMTYPGGTHDLWLRYVLKAANRGMPRPSPMGSVSRSLRPKISGRTIPRRPSWSAPS